MSYVHLYTGNGKGKTTAAIGLALRAAGAGQRVFIAQFVKGMRYSEISFIDRRIPSITTHRYGSQCFLERGPSPDDIRLATQGLAEVRRILRNGRYATQDLIDTADLVTDMQEVKHYYNEGVAARPGIEC